jgi:hypothetical protein
MRIGLITTLNTNLGDDLVREGICRVLARLFPRHALTFIPVNKHEPLSVYPRWHPIQLARATRYLPRGRFRMARWLERGFSTLRLSRFETCDLIVQCGAPVMWAGCHACEWAGPLWHRVVGRLSQRIPVLNLAAGSCYPWERQPTEVADPLEARYLRTILGYCRLNTVRDKLAQRLSTSLGVEAPVIPCSSFLVADGAARAPANGELLLISYMARAGHYDWNQGIDPAAWRETVKTLLTQLRMRHRLAFLCHNAAEVQLAEELDSTVPRIWPRTSQEYPALVAEAKVALCNRLHASVALASLGIPSVAVGTDTRLLMVEALGLPCLYVKQATVGRLEEELENLLRHRLREQERLLALRAKTWSEYVEVVAGALEN